MDTKNFIIALSLCVSNLLATPCYDKALIQCTLKGEVIDRPQTSNFILHKQFEDPRIHGIRIPIIDGKFEYVFDCEHEEMYYLTFNDEYESGAWKPVPFFSEQGVIQFTLYPFDRYDENKTAGSKLTTEYWDYLKPITSKYKATKNENLAKSKQYLEENFGEVENKHEKLEDDLKAKLEQLENDGVDIESVKKELSEIEKSLYHAVNQEVEIFTLQYIRERTNVVAYSILLSNVNFLIQMNQINQEDNEITQYTQLYQTVIAPKFPDHPYTERMENLLASLSVKAGAPFVDFTTGDLSGTPVKLSERIAGKLAIVHLWASWCGPCRKKGIDLIPVYEEFRDKGLVVIGVAREKEVDTAKASIEKDNYPWENLVELNDAEKIWEKYGIGNSGGMVFLIDKNGIIIATDPSVEEIRNFLIEKL